MRRMMAAALCLLPGVAMAQPRPAPLPQPDAQQQLQAAMGTVADLLRGNMQQRAQIIADEAEIARLRAAQKKEPRK